MWQLVLFVIGGILIVTVVKYVLLFMVVSRRRWVSRIGVVAASLVAGQCAVILIRSFRDPNLGRGDLALTAVIYGYAIVSIGAGSLKTFLLAESRRPERQPRIDLPRRASGRGNVGPGTGEASPIDSPVAITAPVAQTSEGPVERRPPMEPFKRVKIYEEGQPIDPVTPENPLQGIELKVLKVWLENSQELKRLYQVPEGRAKVEEAVRVAVDAAHGAELLYRGEGMPYEQATELTAPGMWTPPTLK